MQYTLTIDQQRSLEWGLSMAQALLFDFLTKTAIWANARQIDGATYYHIRRKKLAEDLPLVSQSSATFKRHLIALESAGVIERKVINATPYVRITAKGSTWNQPAQNCTPAAEVSPNDPVQNCTPGAELHRDPVQNCTPPGAELHTYQNTNNQTTRDQPSPAGAREAARPSDHKPKLSVDDLQTDYALPADLAGQFMAIRCDKKLTLTPKAMHDLVREFGKAGLSLADGIELCCTRSWAGFKASWDWRDDGANNGKSNTEPNGSRAERLMRRNAELWNTPD